jgi:hypothetical protein
MRRVIGELREHFGVGDLSAEAGGGGDVLADAASHHVLADRRR